MQISQGKMLGSDKKSRSRIFLLIFKSLVQSTDQICLLKSYFKTKELVVRQKKTLNHDQSMQICRWAKTAVSKI